MNQHRQGIQTAVTGHRCSNCGRLKEGIKKKREKERRLTPVYSSKQQTLVDSNGGLRATDHGWRRRRREALSTLCLFGQ